MFYSAVGAWMEIGICPIATNLLQLDTDPIASRRVVEDHWISLTNKAAHSVPL